MCEGGKGLKEQSMGCDVLPIYTAIKKSKADKGLRGISGAQSYVEGLVCEKGFGKA